MKHKLLKTSTNAQLQRQLRYSNDVACSKTVLSNGIRVLTENVPGAQSFALGVWVDVGSADETRENSGIAHFIEHLVFRGTRRRSSKQISNYLESVGGYINAFTAKDHSCYYTRALKAHFGRSLELLADIITEPVFRAEDIEKERTIILEEIKSLEDEPEELINDYLDASLFGSHPLARPISGTLRSVRSINREQICAFHAKEYSPDRLIVAAAGDIDHEAVCRQVEELFPMEKSQQTTVLKALPRFIKTRRQERKGPGQQAHYTVGVTLPRLNDVEYYAISAFNVILGDGMSSRLNQSIREKRGLCYTVYSGISDFRNLSIVSVYAAMEQQNLPLVEQLVVKELTQAREKPVSKQELRRAKEQLKSSLIIGLESLSGRMNLLAKSELYLGRYEFVGEKLDAIDAISVGDIQRVASTWLQPERFHTVILYPEGEDA